MDILGHIVNLWSPKKVNIISYVFSLTPVYITWEKTEKLLALWLSEEYVK